MKILLSNDDGVFSKGIEVLAQTLKESFEVNVLAPDRNRSAASHALTLHRPLRIKQLASGFFSADGTPTDCVHLGLTGFFSENAELVVAGINEGQNLGDDVFYSGTVAAAIEGRHLGYPSIAVSMVGENITHFKTAAHFTRQIILKLKQNNFLKKTILNINVPDVPIEKINGIMVTRLGARHAAELTCKSNDPRGREIYWIGRPGKEADCGPGTDFHAIKNNFVSITPLNLDLTNHSLVGEITTWLNSQELVSS